MYSPKTSEVLLSKPLGILLATNSWIALLNITRESAAFYCTSTKLQAKNISIHISYRLRVMRARDAVENYHVRSCLWKKKPYLVLLTMLSTPCLELRT